MNDFTCNQFMDLIFDYIDGELNTDEKLKIEEHMKNCSECRIEYQKSKELLSMIKESRYTSDNRLYTALVPRLEQMKKHSFLNKIRIYGSVAVAAVITIVMIVYAMPVMNPKIADNSQLFEYSYDVNEEQIEEAEEEIIIEETKQEIAAEKIMPSQISLFSGIEKAGEAAADLAAGAAQSATTMTDYLNTYAPEYIDKTEALYVSYDDVDLPEEIVADKVVNDIKYSIFIIDRFSNIAFDVGDLTEYSSVYYSETDSPRYVIILKLNSK